MNRYTGKKTVVIGGTHGMGVAIVKALLGPILLGDRNCYCGFAQ